MVSLSCESTVRYTGGKIYGIRTSSVTDVPWSKDENKTPTLPPITLT